MKISVIVPVYNSEKFLERCLDSLINQTLKDIEIICINDGSTDNSESILEKYSQSDSRIKIITKENEGVSISRNIGIDRATGEYIGFVDSDDWVDLNYFEKLYNAAKKYDTDIAVAGIIRLDKFRKRTYLHFNQEITTKDINTKVKLCDIPDRCYVWNKIYKTEKIRQKNLKFAEGTFYEDVIFTPKALYNLNQMVTVPDTFYYYWRHAGSIVTLRSQKVKEDYKCALREAISFFKKYDIDVSELLPEIKKYKIFGFSIFKIRKKGKITKYILFNIIKFTVKAS